MNWLNALFCRKAIAYAPHGLDAGRDAAGQLGPNATDVGVHDADVSFEVVAPDLLQKRLSREGAAAIPETPGWTRFVMVASAATILFLGVMPELAIRDARAGVPELGVFPQAEKAPAPPPVALSR